VGVVSSSALVPAAASRTPFEQLAEEYVSFTNANFLVAVLLRMRTMVVGGVGMYVFLLLALSSYLFSPSPTIFLVGVELPFVLMFISSPALRNSNDTRF
jgi:hypothetical protein